MAGWGCQIQGEDSNVDTCSLLKDNQVIKEENHVGSDTLGNLEETEYTEVDDYIHLGDSLYKGGLYKALPHGQGIMHWGDHKIYDGQWVLGQMQGTGIMTWPSGHKYEGMWQDSEMHGEGVMYYPDGAVYKGQYVNGLRHGMGRLTQPNGEWFEGEFIKGNITDNGAYYASDGRKRTINQEKQKCKPKPSIGRIIWMKTWRLWASLACFGLGALCTMWLFDFFSGKGSSHIRVKGIVAPVMAAILGVKYLIAFFANLTKPIDG